jgi:DNA repair protein RadC
LLLFIFLFTNMPFTPLPLTLRESTASVLPTQLPDVLPALGEMPQERMESEGPAALRDQELICLILRSGTAGRGVRQLAGDILTASGSLQRLMRWRREDFIALPGLGPVKAAQLAAVFEIARRILAAPEEEAPPRLDAPASIVRHMRPYACGLDVEKFWVLCLNRRLRLIRLLEITSGTATSSLVHPREVFREAIRAGSCSVVCVHNHPSGDPSPSSADLLVTRQLRQAASTLDIDIVDHVILGTVSACPRGVGYYSFREAGVL